MTSAQSTERPTIDEKKYSPMSGWGALIGCLLGLVIAFILVLGAAAIGNKAVAIGVIGIIGGILLGLVSFICLFGFMAIAPNQARALLLFGDYKGSVSKSGFYWVNPFFSKKKISLRIRNFETGSVMTPEQKDPTGRVVQAKTRSAGKPSKVNDKDGNPIDISAIVVWRVVNTAEALFEVDDYEDFVAVQSEAALRNLAQRHPYDSEDHEISLRGNTVEVCDQLGEDIQARLDKAGVEVIEARISHLAYSPEIAAAMLQRQQAQAVVAARTQIVEGAVGMVEMALDHLKRDKIVTMNEEQRSHLVSNLLVVLCSDRHTQPVVNIG
jgi:regulator of protease activity HflC (stomatin/prohibitin superfamily)